MSAVETESTLHVLQSSKVEWIEESRLNKTWTRKGLQRNEKQRGGRGTSQSESKREREKMSKGKVQCENKGERKTEKEAEQRVSQQ